MADGHQAPRENVQTKKLERTGVKDLVSGEVRWLPGGIQSFADVTTPTILGYTPDQPLVKGAMVGFGAAPVETIVTYRANEQAATLTIIDEMTDQTLQAEVARGRYGQPIQFVNLASWLEGLESRGYRVRATDFGQQTYRATDDENRFTVRLAHKMVDVTATDPGAHKAITRTIRVAHPLTGEIMTVKQVATLTRPTVKDLVTREVNYGKWSKNHSWAAFIPESIAGYRPSRVEVPAQEVTAETGAGEETITYQPLEPAHPLVSVEPGLGEPKAGQLDLAKGLTTLTAEEASLPQIGNANRGVALAGIYLLGLVTTLLGWLKRQKFEKD